LAKRNVEREGGRIGLPVAIQRIAGIEFTSLRAPRLRSLTIQGVTVNKDHIAGKAKGMFGKLQSALGKLTGNKSQRAKGAGKRVAGKAQEALGDARGAARRKPASRRSAGRARP
jgi:uncharacterized protein YjbJ (UPF0337 family)